MKKFFSTKEAAEFLGVNEKMIYSLISDKGLPATKITGKWLFPKHLVEQWLENATINYPKSFPGKSVDDAVIIFAGSNDILLEKALNLFNDTYHENLAVFANLGSMGGIKALGENLCHIAASHLVQDDDEDYNFEFISELLKNAPVTELPAVLNFSLREQGIIVAKDNPKKIGSIVDFREKNVTIVNRDPKTGTRHLLDRELAKADIDPNDVRGYNHVVSKHMEVGLEILKGSADAGLGIRTVAEDLGLDFIHLRWERYDLMVSRDRFFDKSIQHFLGMLHEKAFLDMASSLKGYDLSLSGKMVYPKTAPVHSEFSKTYNDEVE